MRLKIMEAEPARRLIGAICMVLLIMIFVPTTAPAVNLTYSIFFPATHGITKSAEEWAAEIDKRTNGQVKVTLFPGATLTPPDQCYDGVVKGISDIGMSVLSYSKGRFPLTEVIDLPLGYQNAVQVTRLCNAYYDKFKPKELDDVKIMYLHGHGPGILHSKKPISTLEELKGNKIRCSGTSARVVTALGATPVAMPQNETYDALQKGIADGVVSPIETLKGWKIGEVITSTTKNLSSSYSLCFFVAMNKKKWDALPKDVQETIEKVNLEFINRTGQRWDDLDKEGTEYTLARGNKIIELSKEENARWAEAVKPVLADFVAGAKTKNLPGDEALSFCQKWLVDNPAK
jgi:TRAP-type transport system periplasmic protein